MCAPPSTECSCGSFAVKWASSSAPSPPLFSFLCLVWFGYILWEKNATLVIYSAGSRLRMSLIDTTCMKVHGSCAVALGLTFLRGGLKIIKIKMKYAMLVASIVGVIYVSDHPKVFQSFARNQTLRSSRQIQVLLYRTYYVLTFYFIFYFSSITSSRILLRITATLCC